MTKELWEGACVGGPMDGQTAVSRFPEGFVLLDPDTARRAWIYDLKPDGRFVCRDGGASSELHPGKAWFTAEGTRFDVLAFDPESMAA